jgi:predicted small lipoprotein YifL
MSHLRIIVLAVVAACLLAGCGTKPPLVVRYDRTNNENYGLYVTNTSEAPLHGITFHCEQNGTTKSSVAIDTIPAHGTVFMDVFRFGELRKALGITSSSSRTVTVTCSGFDGPLAIPDI